MGNKIRGYLIDVENNVAMPVTIDNSLEGYYSILNCDCIDVVSRRIGGKWYDIVCDDEALLKDGCKISAIGNDGTIRLYGNLFIVQFDGADGLMSLSDPDLEHINSCITHVIYGDNTTPSLVLGECGMNN